MHSELRDVDRCGATKTVDGSQKLVCNKPADHVARGDRQHGRAVGNLPPYVEWSDAK